MWSNPGNPGKVLPRVRRENDRNSSFAPAAALTEAASRAG
jgi:hypothetical protein